MDKKEPHESLKSIGGNIRKTRIFKGHKNMEDFANLVMINKDYYGGIERGQQNFTIEKLIRIAEILGVPIEEFFMKNPKEVSVKFMLAENNLEAFRKLLGQVEYIMQIKDKDKEKIHPE